MSSISVVDTDAHYIETLTELAPYVEEPWKSRFSGKGNLEEGSKLPVDLFPGSTGDRSVYGRIRRDDFDYPNDMTPEDIPIMMEHLDVEDAIILSQIMLSFSRLKGADERPVILANAYVDYMLDKVVNPREGIYTMIPAPYQDPEEAVDLIDRVGDESGIVGICMISGGAEPPLGNRKYDVIYRAAEKADLPVIFHAGGAGLDQFHIRGYEKFIETHTLGFLNANMSQMTSLIVQGIPEKFPDLDIVFQESGIFWVPLMMHRLDTEYLKRQSEAPLLQQKPSKYMGEFYYGIQPMELPENENYLESIIEMIGGPERLLYASDYPHWDYDLPDVILDRPFLSEKEKQMILSDSAREVFDI